MDSLVLLRRRALLPGGCFVVNLRSMRNSSLLLLAAPVLVALSCGADRETGRTEDEGRSPANADGEQADSSTDTSISLGAAPGTGETGHDSTSGGAGGAADFQQCAESHAPSRLTPVYLVFLLDQSSSMGDGEHGNREQKWDPVTQALSAFFSGAQASGLYASLTLFPNDANPTDGFGSIDYPILCASEDYTTPTVPPHLLPDGAPFDAAIAAVDPPNEMGTPTTPALSGSIEYAQSLVDEGKKAAIIMVTDGEPAGCSAEGNTIFAAAAMAEEVADRVPVYVIGVGSALEQLDLIADAGGTGSAFVVDIEDPEQTRTALLEKVRQIQDQQVSCDLTITPPPDGENLDPQKVNVHLSTEHGTRILGHNQSCANDVGWRYDDADFPQVISLCKKSCALVQSSLDGGVEVAFGCETEELIIR